MDIDGQFYFCEGCRTWQPFMGRDVTCDCGYIFQAVSSRW